MISLSFEIDTDIETDIELNSHWNWYCYQDDPGNKIKTCIG